MTLIPELPLSSLGLKSGEQIIVSENPDTSSPAPFPSSPSKTSSAPAPAPRSDNSSSNSRPIAPTPAPISPPTPTKSSTPDHVETSGGVLVHRVSSQLSAFTTERQSFSLQVVPDDNSCLFSAVALIFEQDISKASQMRKSALPSFPILLRFYSSACG